MSQNLTDTDALEVTSPQLQFQELPHRVQAVMRIRQTRSFYTYIRWQNIYTCKIKCLSLTMDQKITEVNEHLGEWIYTSNLNYVGL